MIETSLDLPRKSFATSVIFGIFEKCLPKLACSPRIIWRYLKIFGKWSEIFQKPSKTSLCLCLYNKTIHVACRYEISLLVFNFHEWAAIPTFIPTISTFCFVKQNDFQSYTWKNAERLLTKQTFEIFLRTKILLTVVVVVVLCCCCCVFYMLVIFDIRLTLYN